MLFINLLKIVKIVWAFRINTFVYSEKLEVSLDGRWKIEKMLYPGEFVIENKMIIDEKKDIFGNVVLLKKDKM